MTQLPFRNPLTKASAQRHMICCKENKHITLECICVWTSQLSTFMQVYLWTKPDIVFFSKSQMICNETTDRSDDCLNGYDATLHCQVISLFHWKNISPQNSWKQGKVQSHLNAPLSISSSLKCYGSFWCAKYKNVILCLISLLIFIVKYTTKACVSTFQ